MKKIVATVALAIIAAALAFDFNHYTTEEHKVIVRSGDTFDKIAGDFYEQDDRNPSWQEFRYDVMSENAKLTNNGRCLQPGDVVTVTIRKKAK